MPTPKQVSYIMFLLAKAGYSTRYMDTKFKALGASMRQRSGKVQDWVESLNSGEASALIDRLKSE